MFFLAGCGSPHPAANTSSTYNISRTLPLEGDGFWDYLAVDEPTQRLFVSHGTQVQVIDLVSGKQVGAIPHQNGVHGIAFAPEVNKGFITNGRDTTVTVFDLKTLAVKGKIMATGANPDAVLYDPFSKHIFAFNHSGHSATVIDPVTEKVLGNIPLSGDAEFGVSDGKGRVFVNIEDKGEVQVINATTMKVEKSWPTAPGEEPTGLAYDAENQRLFSVCDEKMVVLDAVSGKVRQTISIGGGTDGVAYDPATHRVFSSNGEGSVTVVDASGKDCKVLENLTTRRGARTITLDRQTHRVYLPTADFEDKPATNGRPAAKAGSFVVLEVSTKEGN